MAWFKKARTPFTASAEAKASRVPEGLWVKCPGCSQIIYNKDLATNLNVCPKCAHHFRIGALERLRTLFDDGVWVEHDQGLASTNPLQFTDTKPYKERLAASSQRTACSADRWLQAACSGGGACLVARSAGPSGPAGKRYPTHTK